MSLDLFARPPHYEIVVGLDLSEDADATLHHAFDQAATRDGVTVHVVAVVPDRRSVWQRARRLTVSPALEAARDELVATVERCIEDAVPEATRDHWSLRLHVAHGRLEEQIVAYAADLGAALIVVGAGRVAVEEIVRQADCPVLAVARPRDAVALAPSCVDCVDIRHWSKGERWFCARHQAARPGRMLQSA